jgi:oligopeptidase A
MSSPEIPEEAFVSNPLLGYADLPPFNVIRADHALPALLVILTKNRQLVDRILAIAPASWAELATPLEEMEDSLDRVWSPIRHLHSVCDSPQMREAYNGCLPLLSEYSTDLGQNRALYEAYERLLDTPLDKTQKKIVSDMLRDFRLSGVALKGDSKIAFKKLEADLAELKAAFEQNVLDATQAWSKRFTNAKQLAGIPETALASARHRAEMHGFDGYEFSLESPDYLAVMTYADSREFRREMHEAYQTRASDRGPHAGRFDNSENMERILSLRHEKARLLDYPSYAELSLASKMAGRPKQVLQFLTELAEKARPYAQREWEELKVFAAQTLDIRDLQAHDLAYVSEKLKHRRYAYSREDLKPYLPVEQVLNGLFKLVERLYGMRIQENDGIEAWHSDVRFFSIMDSRGRVRGHFYLDMYAREHKRGGAWMDECRGRWLSPQGLRTPVAYLTCNAARPAPGNPALIAHDEMVTLFHEFGHGLHHLLTQVDYAQASGIRGVEWDAVELPSQFMENWCWQDEVLGMVAKHHLTGEGLPAELSERLRSSKNFLSGLSTLRQIEFALFDFRLHLEYKPEQPGRTQEILDAVRSDVAVIRAPEYARFQHSFTHIFAGGYGAGYYSYKWAEVLSADVFELFEEQGLFDGRTGRRFLRNILEKGGTRPAMDLFKSFRKRKPKVDALLRHSGLAA